MPEATPAVMEGMESLRIEAQLGPGDDLIPSIWQDLPAGLDRPFMVNFGDLVKSILFSPNFLDLAPTMGKFDATDVSHLLEKAGENTHIEKDKFGYAVAEGEVWFVETFTDAGVCTRDRKIAILALSKNPPSVKRLAELYVERSMILCSFTASYKAFV
ncbi:hypothetical protein R1sor_021104 [Riccia sorocarpa]|uniref:Profilin n=1 Tax=Riccia sorocarpa TaxID=122646 RepID=A0ABD3GG37_9MARC